MRVLLVGPLPPPIGGQSMMMQSILNSGLRSRVEFSVLDVAHTVPRRAARLWLSLRFVAKFTWMLVRMPSIRVVHVHTSAGRPMMEKGLFVAVARLLGRRTVMHVHGGRFREFWDGSGALNRGIVRWILNLNRMVVVLTDQWSQYYREHVRCTADVRVLRNAVNVPALTPAARTDRSVTFVYLGHLKKEKGVIDLLRAWRRLEAARPGLARLKIVGRGDTAENEAEVHDHFARHPSPGVQFCGLLLGEQKWAALAGADVFVLPSHSEDLPLSILEAMALSLPVVTTDVGSIRYAVEEGRNGRLLAPHDVDGLFEAMRGLLDDPPLRARMSEASRAKFEREYHFERFERQLGEIYREAAQ